MPRIDLLAAFEARQRSGDEGNRRDGRGRQVLHRIARDEKAPVALMEEDRREHDGIPLQFAEGPSAPRRWADRNEIRPSAGLRPLMRRERRDSATIPLSFK